PLRGSCGRPRPGPRRSGTDRGTVGHAPDRDQKDGGASLEERRSCRHGLYRGIGRRRRATATGETVNLCATSRRPSSILQCSREAEFREDAAVGEPGDGGDLFPREREHEERVGTGDGGVLL